jgi:hypothetical protein
MKGVGPGVYPIFVDFGLKKKYPAQPLLRPTFDGAQDRAFDLFSEISKSELERSAKE